MGLFSSIGKARASAGPKAAAPAAIAEAQEEPFVVLAPVSGRPMSLAEVGDGVFSEGLVGLGAAVMPSSGEVLAPVSGKVVMVAETRHAIGIQTGSSSVLVHMGLETVGLGGRPFEVACTVGQTVRAGDPIATMDLGMLSELEVSPVVIVVVSDCTDEGRITWFPSDGDVVAGRDPLFECDPRP